MLSVFSDRKLALACFDLMSQAHMTVSIIKMKTQATGVSVKKVLPIGNSILNGFFINGYALSQVCHYFMSIDCL